MKSFSIIFALLAVSAVVIFGCKKNAATSPKNYTHNMAGIHSWTGVEYWYRSGFSAMPDTIINRSNDSAAIVVINDTAIVYQFDTLRYIYANNEDTIAFARSSYSDSTAFLFDTLWYNYSHDVITFHRYMANTYDPYTFVYMNEHTP
jgi:hypothetical protein